MYPSSVSFKDVLLDHDYHKGTTEQLFLAQPNDASRIRFCLQSLYEEPPGSLTSLPDATEMCKPKNDSAALRARQIGNDYFASEDFISAMDWYNRSICYAPKDSENLALGYANRSAVFLKTGFFKFCLENIEIALNLNCPSGVKEKLLKRQEDCEEIMSKRRDNQEIYDAAYDPWSLTHPEGKKTVPMVIEGLEFVKNDFGSSIFAARDLMPGEVLMIEKAYSNHVKKHSEFTRCANCLNQNYLNLIPCDRCTKAMFCSTKCQLEGDRRFHKYECKIKDGMIKFFPNYVWPIGVAIRAVLRAFTMFDDPQKLKSFIEKIEKEGDNIDFLNFSEKEHFRAAYFLPPNILRTPVELFKHTREVAAAWYFLQRFTELPFHLTNRDLEDLFLSLLFRFYEIAITNGIILCNKNEDLDTYATGIFTFDKLMKHSCMPNVVRINDKDVLRIVAKRKIEAGNELVINYSEPYSVFNRKQRQEILQTQFNIYCACDACLNDYPVTDEMVPSNLVLGKVICDDLKELNRTFDKNLARMLIQKYQKFIVENESNPKLLELYVAEGVLIVALCTLMFGPPLKNQFKSI